MKVKQAIEQGYLICRRAGDVQDEGFFTYCRAERRPFIVARHGPKARRASLRVDYITAPGQRLSTEGQQLLRELLRQREDYVAATKADPLYLLNRVGPGLVVGSRLLVEELEAIMPRVVEIVRAHTLAPDEEATASGAGPTQSGATIAGVSGNNTFNLAGNFAGRDIYLTQQEAAPVGVQARHQLRRPPDDFTGREVEIAVLLERMEGGGATISGVQGMGGIGKTALALVVADRLRDHYPDAQLLVEMRAMRPNPLSVAGAMEHVIRAYHPTAKLPEGEAALRPIYQSVLDGQRALLLLDDALDRAQVEVLLPPKSCGLLVTSRQHFRLPGLRALDLGTLPPTEAVTLLQRIAPRLTGEEAAHLAARCGYLPLALTLVGSALAERPDLSPAAYLRRLDDEHQRPVEFAPVDAVLATSYALLDEGQQRRFCALALFPATFDLPAAAAVWSQDSDDFATQDALGALVKYSLVEYAGRYRLHDLARLFADSRLTDTEREGAGHRHATYYKALLGAADELYMQGKMMEGLALFDQEWPNIRAGQGWAAARAPRDDATAALCSDYPIAGVYVLNLRQHPRERIGWLESALAAARRLGHRQAEANRLGNLGIAYADLGETQRAIDYFEQYLAITRDVGDRRGEGIALGNLGRAYANLGETQRAIDDYYQPQLLIARAIGDRGGEGYALGNLGMAYAALGETRRAIDYHEQRLIIAREMGDRRGEGNALGDLGMAYLALGETRRAIDYYQRQLPIAREIGDRRGEGNALWYMSLALEKLGQRNEAIALAEAALVIYERNEDPWAAKVRAKLAAWRGEVG